MECVEEVQLSVGGNGVLVAWNEEELNLAGNEVRFVDEKEEMMLQLMLA